MPRAGAASSHPDTCAASGAEQEPAKDPDPQRRSFTPQEQPGIRRLRNRPACGNSGYAPPAACPVSTLPGTMVPGARRLAADRHLDLDPHGQTRPGQRSPRSHTVKNRRLVFGSNNFRSPNILWPMLGLRNVVSWRGTSGSVFRVARSPCVSSSVSHESAEGWRRSRWEGWPAELPQVSEVSSPIFM